MTTTTYFDLSGTRIEGALPDRFIQLSSNGVALMWDFTGETAESSPVSLELLAIILGEPVQAPHHRQK